MYRKMSAKCFFLIILVIFFSAIYGVSVKTQESPHGPLVLQCDLCHNPDDWEFHSGNGFNHNQTGFPLKGEHERQKCVSCHKNLVFSETGKECFRCHEDIHEGKLGIDCSKCHNTFSFVVAEDMSGFHNATRFPLRGAHQAVPCIDCHLRNGGEIWRGLATECVSCHYDSYKNVKDPDHVALGFSTDCQKCHNENFGFFHGLFPVDHAGKKNTCLTCHPNPSDYKEFTCFASSCHSTRTHDKNYSSAQCYSCHPNGQGGD